MDIDLVFKIAAVGIVVAVLNQLLVRSDRPDQAMLVSLAGLITTMMLLVREISSLFDLFDFCERVLLLTDLPLTLFVPVVKVTAIALVARFSCALCADAGQSALSSLLAAAGTLCALVCALPLMEALLEMVEGFL